MTAYTYDGNGNVIKESVTSNKPGETTAYRNTYYQYDSMNRLIKTNTDEPGETLYEYDLSGNVTKMTTGAVNGAGGVSTTYEYDSQNRLVKTTDPMGYTETYTYDNNGNIASMTDKNGTVTTNTYNAVNNLLNSASVKDATTQTTTYTYGAASGVLLGISDDNSSISYSYNKKGQQTGESRSTGETLTYTYDKDGNQTGMTMSANNGDISQNLSYTYNYLGQMTEVKDNAANEVIAAYTYDGNGNITEKKTNGNSMITEYTYNESGLIKTVENQTVADPLRNIKGTYSKYSYNYYLDGNQSDITDVFNKIKTYTYDGAGRLKTEGDGNDWVTYYYDERGNRSIKHDTRGDEAIYYSYNANNMLTGTEINLLESGVIPMSILPVKEENTSYQYDKNGNVISMHRWIYENPYIGDDEDYIYTETNIKEETYEYDLLNRLTSYSQTNHEEGESVSADYAYDPTGMRISKKLENENQINYVWSGGNIIGEYGIDGSKTYLRGAGGEIVKTKDGNSEERYFAYNGHGDTTSIIEKDPESVSFGVTATYEYDAFGNLIEGSETGETHENSFRYNGQQVDEESGLIYLRNRYYNPEIGRFITEDPIRDGTNWYVYCINNPIALFDAFGLDPDNYVMIKYSVEKTGMFSFNGFDSERLISYIRNDFTGETIGFQVDRVVQIEDDNGDIVSRAISNVDALYGFLYSFGYRGTPESLLHNPEDRFNSLNETAFAWALRYNKESMTCLNDEGDVGYEIGSYIYLDSASGQYYFGYPAKDMTKNKVFFGPANKAVGMIHSHDTDDPDVPDEMFSYADIETPRFRSLHRFIVTPSGRLLYSFPTDSFSTNENAGFGRVIVGSGAGIFSGVYVDG